MIIHDFNIKGIAIFETEAYAPLIVDANAPLTFAVMRQGFQPVRWRHAEIVEADGPIQLGQAHSRTFQYVLRQAA